ncbi:ribulose-bisphosphate carboxylase large subunit family protein [Pelagicoccus enzymogenes]|uniref:ribulose-bisphosphate carboxylase large subunit family protein n=1 Tax=Pelagicoccus enzymogenes TaxID=2773457 RepID=UPI00280F1DDB|nr:ribulose-bisphosphate carboxylase large subunit family protein [Pelagicoccus enzymogenes]MDQ8197668.1 ribulose-bisphosphate carboxylase large subunit family protein [Pelagicoccus enzymogenes]
MERIYADYFIETPFPLEKAAATLAGEQSSGTFVAVPGETEELKARFAARVESIEALEVVSTPSIPSEKLAPGKYQQARVRVSWSIENFGYNLPTLISTLQGNLYELTQFTGLKLMDLEVPDSYASHFRGPKFGVEGCRRLTGVEERPLIGTIIKPSIGMTPADTAEIVKALVEAGIDFIKDDELMSSAANSPFAERVSAIMAVINEYAERTGKKVMYAFNVSDELDAMLRNYETVVKAGGTCAMVSLNSVGLAGAKKICDQGALAIHGHRNGWGMLNRHPLLGIEFPAYQKLWRLAGVDQIHVNGIANKFWESDDSVVRSMEACGKPLLGGFSVLPVVSSGQWGGQAFETYRRVPTVDLLYMAGGGIMGHPGGPSDGVRALQQAWNGAVSGLSLEETADAYPEFGASVEKFGKK